MENHKFEHHLIEIDGKPVAIGSLFSHGQVGGIFNVGTLPEYRRKGYGKAMTEFLMHRADTKGLKQLVLLSSPEAENLYSNLGFKKVCPIEIFAH